MGCFGSKAVRAEEAGEISLAIKAEGRYEFGNNAEEGRWVSEGKSPSSKALLGRAGTYGLDKAVKVLDTLGSSMTNLTPSSGFSTGVTSGCRSNKVTILAFEVANTIVKAANLMKSLSEQSIQSLKNHVIDSDGIQHLVSTNTKDLLTLAASDKMEEFRVFSVEVIRFGDRCKDAQWHNLGRYFEKLDSDPTPKEKLREEAATTTQELISLAQYTSELYHELDTHNRMEQECKRKLKEEESIPACRRDETALITLHTELKQQRKIVKGLKKKSLWFKNLDEVVENLVEVVVFLHKHILEAFDLSATEFIDARRIDSPNKLGVSGLALHYANVINQINSIASRPMTLVPNTRNTLYGGLPMNVKEALRSRLLSFHIQEELTISFIKTEMEKTLGWILPMAENTIKAHQGFGWVGEWATNSVGSEGDMKLDAHQKTIFRIQTLYHADKEKTEENILQLAVWLHHLVYQAKNNGYGSENRRINSSLSISKTRNSTGGGGRGKITTINLQLSREESQMVEDVSHRGLVLVRSKSHGFLDPNEKKKLQTTEFGSSRSAGSSPTSQFRTVLASHIL